MTQKASVNPVKQSKMNKDMQQFASASTMHAIEKYSADKDIASAIKKQFDKKYGSTWHVIVGKNFISNVSHQPNMFIHLFIGHISVQIFKSKS